MGQHALATIPNDLPPTMTMPNSAMGMMAMLRPAGRGGCG
jgi:hypothetical protein